MIQNLPNKDDLKKMVHEGIQIINIIVVSLVLLLIMTISIVFLSFGELATIGDSTFIEYPLLSISALSLPLFISLFIIPYVFAVKGQKMNKNDLLLSKPKGKTVSTVNYVSILLSIIITVYFFSNEPMFLYVVIINFIVIAFVEEFFFRGYVQQRLLRILGPVASITISSALFAFILHSNMSFTDNLIYRMPVGLILGFIAYKSQSIWPAVNLHYGYNVLLSTL